MEVSDADSLCKLIEENKPARITKLKHLHIRDSYSWNSAQHALFTDAIQRSNSLTSLHLSMANYNVVESLRNILPTHPTIRSVTIYSEIPSRFVELASFKLEPMIEEAHWTELKIIIVDYSTVHEDLITKICRGLMKNKTVTTLDMSKCSIRQSNVDDLEQLFAVNNTINTLFIDVDDSVSLIELSQVLEQKKQLVSFGILGVIDQGGTTNWTNLARALRANPSLTHLELHPQVNEGESQEIVELIHKNQLKSLEADFYEQDIDLIYEAMLANTSITSIDFSASQYENCDLLSEVIKVHPALEHLGISIEAEPHQLSLIMSALKHNRHITSLNIANCDFGKMWHEIYDTFQVNTTVRHLTLSHSSLPENDWKYFKEMLRSSSTLKSLTYVHFLPEAFEELCQGISMNTSLTSLSINVAEDLKHTYLDTLLKALKGNKTLRSVNIDATDVNLLMYHPDNIYDDLVESINIVNLPQQNARLIADQGYERKVARRREITNLVISLFNIARRQESFEFLPREIWLQIFANIHSTYLNVGDTAAAIFTDKTIRKMVDFDKDEYVPIQCHFDSTNY